MSRLASAAAPLLLALVPLATLLAVNIEVVSPSVAARSMIATLLSVAALTLILRAVLRDRVRALVIACLVALLLSSGTVYHTVGSSFPGAASSTLAKGARVLWVLAIATAAVAVWRVGSLRTDLAVAFFVVAVPMLLIPGVSIVRHELEIRQPYDAGFATPKASGSPRAELPDIYYVILDGFGRDDVLWDLYQVDSRPFLDSLRELGFYIADRSLANYGQTTLSLASSLNMSSLEPLKERLGESATTQMPVSRLIRHSLLRQVLEAHGYEWYAFETGYRRTELEDSDHFLAPSKGPMNAFEVLYADVLGLTPVIHWFVENGWLAEMPGFESHRHRLSLTFEQARLLPDTQAPKFVFIHVIFPHPPFVFDASGSPVSGSYLFQIKDGTEFAGTRQEYADGYAAQVRFAQRQSLALVSHLLRDPVRPLVIILQADHGPGMAVDWENPENTDLRERMSILNAYYAPQAEADLYPEITPVNSFRVLLNSYLGYDLPLLPDHSYFSSWRAPYKFIPYDESE